jgi:transcriptional regulator with XRE-family HTH domain
MENGQFPNKLKRYRRINGYSQKKVARLLGLADTGTLSRWEHGHVLPGMIHVFRLARLYHAQPEELYDELWKHLCADPRLSVPAEGLLITHQPSSS